MISPKKPMQLVAAICLSLTAVGCCIGQERPAPTPGELFAKWKDYGSSFPSRRSIKYSVKSSNKFIIPEGEQHLSQNDENISWYTGSSPTQAIKAIARNETNSFVLFQRAEKASLEISRMVLHDESDPIQDSVFALPSAGGVYGFFYLPVMNIQLSELESLAEFVEFSNTKISDAQLRIDFKIQRDKIDKEIAGGNDNSTLTKVMNFGLREGHWTVDSTSLLPVEFHGEFKILRDPITIDIIRAANSAGQRRADGSKIPEDLAEPAGKRILQDQGIAFKWRYETVNGKLAISGFQSTNFEDLPSIGMEFEVSKITYGDQPTSYTLNDFGVTKHEPNGQLKKK